MAIQLTPDQIPRFWEAIKWASVNSDYVEVEHRQTYLNHLLYLLLSGKAQCFVRLDEERKLKAIAITKVVVDEMTGKKGLLIRNVYSFQSHPTNEWIDDLNDLVKLAKKQDCSSIYAWSNNPQVERLAKSVNLKELTKSYGMYL